MAGVDGVLRCGADGFAQSTVCVHSQVNALANDLCDWRR